MIGEGVEQSEQKGHGQDNHEEFRTSGQVILKNVASMQLVGLQIIQFRKQVESNPKNKEAAKAVTQRHKQFPQQITVQQPHVNSG